MWVSAHPDVILKMGVKEVLYRTRALGWGTDTDLYRFGRQTSMRRFPARLAAGGPRVLKQNRGNGGMGVWKVELAAQRPRALRRTRRSGCCTRGAAACRKNLARRISWNAASAYFERGGLILDQAFQPRLPEGMIRCYISQAEVVGYGQQLIKALIPPDPAASPDAKPAGPAHHVSGGCAAVPARYGDRWRRNGSLGCNGARYSDGVAAGAVGRRLPLRAAHERRRRHLRAL